MKTNFIFLLITTFFWFSSCKDKNIEPGQLASIVVTNAIVAGGPVKISTNTFDSTLVNTSKTFALSIGKTINLLAYPTTNTSKIYYSNNNVQVNSGDIFSLFICGQYPNGDAIFMKENFPKYTDSVVAVRFINLSPTSDPVNITLSGSTNINQFSNIGYKQITSFKTFVAGPNVNSSYFTFQVRNSTTNTIMATYAFTPANLISTRFRNATLIYKGIIGGTGSNAPGIFFIGHY